MDISLTGSDSTNVERLLKIENLEEVATLEQRWINSWTSSVLVKSALSITFFAHAIADLLPTAI